MLLSLAAFLSQAPGRIAVIGAQALVGSLTRAGVDVCFMGPGTSEMHFVAALDAAPQMRGVPSAARQKERWQPRCDW